MDCQYCNKIFSSKSSLNHHQKTANYCIKLQDNIEVAMFYCEFCNKMFTTKQHLFNHLNVCKEKEKDREIDSIKKEKDREIDSIKKEKDREIESIKKEKDREIESIKKEKDREIKFLNKENDNFRKQLDKNDIQIKELQDKIERMGTIAIKKPTTTNNKTINHVELNQFISQDYINNKITSKFNDQYITTGMRGIVQFVDQHIIRLDNGSYIYGCYDYARKMFKYKDDEGNEVKDPGALKLIRMIQPGLLQQTRVLHQYFDNECSILEREEEKNGRLSRQEQKDLEKMKFLKDSANKTGIIIQSMDKTPEFPNGLSNIST
jgi:hypothetical protein